MASGVVSKLKQDVAEMCWWSPTYATVSSRAGNGKGGDVFSYILVEIVDAVGVEK